MYKGFCWMVYDVLPRLENLHLWVKTMTPFQQPVERKGKLYSTSLAVTWKPCLYDRMLKAVAETICTAIFLCKLQLLSRPLTSSSARTERLSIDTGWQLSLKRRKVHHPSYTQHRARLGEKLFSLLPPGRQFGIFRLVTARHRSSQRPQLTTTTTTLIHWNKLYKTLDLKCHTLVFYFASNFARLHQFHFVPVCLSGLLNLVFNKNKPRKNTLVH